MPDHLDRLDEVLSAGEECGECGGSLRQIGEDVTEELEYIPDRFAVRRITRPRMACMVHVRRKFVDEFEHTGSDIAEGVIERIAKLYAVEKMVRSKPAAVRAVIRQEHAKPIFDDLEVWLADQLPKISGKTPLAAVIRHAFSRLPKARP